MEKLSREERMRQAKASFEKQEAAGRALAFSNKRYKNFKEVIQLLYDGENLSDHFADNRIAVIWDFFRSLNGRKHKEDKRILCEVLQHFATPRGLLSGEEHIYILTNIVGARQYWRNDIYAWKPQSRRKNEQLEDLIHYLFCQYKVPGFLYHVFEKGSRELFVKWLIHLGNGGSPKNLEDMPVALTNKALHYLMLAPGKFRVGPALRWAQVKGLGGSDQLAELVAYSWYGLKNYEDEEFWYGLLQLMVSGGMYDWDQLTGLIDYVRDVKRADPSYSLKGRTLQSLSRQSEAWHSRFTLKAGGNYEWKPSGIEGYQLKRDEKLVQLAELTQYKQLVEEGQKMKHCVHSYAYNCSNGRTAIFSMRLFEHASFVETMATIEVNLAAKKIVQAKGKMNQPISTVAKKHMEVWAAKEGLEVNKYL